LREFCLPWYAVEISVAGKPVTGTEKIVLANQLHSAVKEMFQPMA